MSEATPAPLVLDTPVPATTTTDTPPTTTATPVEGAGASVAPAQPAPAEPVAPATTPTPAPTPTWPEDWREKIAAGDEKRLNQLKRYSDPLAFANKTFSLEAKLSSGEYKRDLPKDATPEQVAEWRREQGLPEAVDGYKIELSEGRVFGEADKPLVEDLQKFAFEKNIRPAILNEISDWYVKKQDELTKQQEVADMNFHDEAKDSLMSEWGLKDYRQNLAAMTSMRDQMPQGLADRVFAGRTSDGKRIGDDPTFLRWFASVSREFNPHASVVGAVGADAVQSELETIRKTRREDPMKYDADKQMQARELELITAQMKSKARQG